MRIINFTRYLPLFFALSSCSHLETELLGFNACENIKFSFDKNIELISKEDSKKCQLVKEGLTTLKCVEIYPAKQQYNLKLKKQTEFL